MDEGGGYIVPNQKRNYLKKLPNTRTHSLGSELQIDHIGRNLTSSLISIRWKGSPKIWWDGNGKGRP